jgi:ketosteroid isomerase-like protein
MGDPKQLIDRGLVAWRARDAEAFGGLYAADATITAPGGAVMQGPDGAKQFMGMWTEACPDNDITITHEYICGSVVVQEGIFSGTQTGTLMTPDGQSIPATGRSLRAPYIDVFETDGDHITSERLYFDQVEMLTQLGLMPAPAAAAS